MALLRLASPLKTLIRQPARSFAIFAATPKDFTQSVDGFVTQALTSHGLQAESELKALKQDKITNMGILKSIDLNAVAGISVGAKTAITRALPVTFSMCIIDAVSRFSLLHFPLVVLKGLATKIPSCGRRSSCSARPAAPCAARSARSERAVPSQRVYY